MPEATSSTPQPPKNDNVIARANALYDAQAERALSFAEDTALTKDARDNAKKVSN